MAEPSTTAKRTAAQVQTFDEEVHGESAERRDTRNVPGGEVRTQRGERSDIPQGEPARGYETTDVSPRALTFALIGFFAGIVLSAALVAGVLYLYRNVLQRPSAPALARREIAPPAPRLEVAPQIDRARIEAEALARLNGYGWTDREAGRAHIPIARAMQLLAEHGWPDPATAESETKGASAEQAEPGREERP